MKTWLYDLMKSIRLVRSCPDKVQFIGVSDCNSLMIESRLRAESVPYRRSEQEYNSTEGKNDRRPKWDTRRSKCVNCGYIYLKCVSESNEFCSLDCKSNAIFLTHMNNRCIMKKNQPINVKQQSIESH